MLHKSKTIYRDLNPTWDEEFDVTVDDLSTPLNVRVRRGFSFSLSLFLSFFLSFSLSEIPCLFCFSTKVFDYDWGMHDDLIGSAVLDLTDFELNKQVSAQSVICSTPAPSIVPVDNLT